MSTSNDEQNGCQPPFSTQSTSASDSRLGNVPDQRQICRKFVWGTCSKSSVSCRFRHELIYEEMIEILKFCHDYQNKQGCTRLGCTYLHTSSEEENLFRTAGEIPQVLQERYANMSKKNNCIQNYEGVPPPPPPPPPPAPAPGQPQPPGSGQPQTLPSVAVAQGSIPPIYPWLQQLPPPPPPPPTTASTPHVQTAPMYTGPPPPPHQNQVFVFNQPPPPFFDTSVPPPMIQTNGAIKRRSDLEAGPSKKVKPDDANADCLCENCVLRERRIDLYKHQMEKLQSEEEYNVLTYKKKLEEHETGKSVLKEVVGPMLYRLLEEFIDVYEINEEPPEPDRYAIPDSSKMLVFKLLEMALTRNNTQSRRQQQQHQHNSPELVNVLSEYIRLISGPSTSQVPPLRNDMDVSNGYMYANGQRAENSMYAPVPSTSRGYCAMGTLPSTSMGSMPSTSMESMPSTSMEPMPSTSSQPPHSAYPAFHPSVPPPSPIVRYYPPGYGAPSGSGQYSPPTPLLTMPRPVSHWGPHTVAGAQGSLPPMRTPAMAPPPSPRPPGAPPPPGPRSDSAPPPHMMRYPPGPHYPPYQ